MCPSCALPTRYANFLSRALQIVTLRMYVQPFVRPRLEDIFAELHDISKIFKTCLPTGLFRSSDFIQPSIHQYAESTKFLRHYEFGHDHPTPPRKFSIIPHSLSTCRCNETLCYSFLVCFFIFIFTGEFGLN